MPERSGGSQVENRRQGSRTPQTPGNAPVAGPHLDVADGPHVVGAWGQVHGQLGLVSPLALVCCMHLQFQHVIGSNEEWGARPMGRKE